ncbi:hypothetical protein JNUCC1_02137 [Lentibacillus sp. JNUCC-1]|uniref:DUF58 domain-containing protein n=1 Tax=Lentibacillus sp. JNUCC-1 TaxID=2654513 RepID=UPI0012E825DF|nr:DUF58 domain-containing protein [Lentibacillus sp. JNUCC-1]MUV38299.1 hypothetical protein [Lentibacillus sp. JNUCC-1]
MWEKTSSLESDHKNDLMLFASGILIFIGGLTGKPLLFMISGVFILYYLLNYIYDKNISDKLLLKNEQEVIRLFPGDQSILSFTFENKSRYPYLNGKLRFDTGNAISIDTDANQPGQKEHQHILPLTMISKGNTVLEVPISAKKRGSVKIVNIDYRFPHLFKFHLIQLSYLPYFQKEIIVYPRPLVIPGLDDYFHTAPGEQRFSMSPFEDIENRIGTRDYQYGDPFHRINWKASVKAQQLQTHTYEKVIDASLVFIINLEPQESWNTMASSSQTEKNLSYAAYLSQFATERKYPFELYLNIRKSGSTPYVHLPEGAGMSHYMRSLELLARVNEYPITFPAEQMMYRIGQAFSRPKTMIIIGPISDRTKRILNEWSTFHRVIHLSEAADQAFLRPIGRGSAS